MKADKFTLTIKAEALSVDSFYGLVVDILAQIDSEHKSGAMRKDDGDMVSFEIETSPVEF